MTSCRIPSASVDALERALEKMRREGLGDVAIRAFEHYHGKLAAGYSGTLPEADIEPVTDLPDAAELPEADAPLDATVIIKLNGGLGTSMGMGRAKSLLSVKGDRTFLDLVADQVLHQREITGARLPLVLMNSFATRDDSLAALAHHPRIAVDLPLDFVQNKVPKIDATHLGPVVHEPDPSLEWAPPGHGDLYTALATSGMLDRLLDAGYRYAFVSNSDNLGAVLEPRILAWMADRGAPFVMEVADRTASDRKGGHLARRRLGGGLVLREIAQTPEADLEAFQDIERHRYFNTNTLWLDLHALRDTLADEGVLDLPMIINRKTVDPRDAESLEVIQLETAMGAAIAVFEGAAAVRVPRERFSPVKTTGDLLVLRSDAYVIGDDHAVHLAPARGSAGPPHVALDGDHYKLLADFEQRFPHGAPSLIDCDSLRVDGDVRFGAGVVVRGDVHLEGPVEIPDGTILEGVAQTTP